MGKKLKPKRLLADLSPDKLVVEDVLKRSGLCQRMKERVDQHRRSRHRRLHVLLRRDGFEANHKKTNRPYVEARMLRNDPRFVYANGSAGQSLRVSQ